MSAGPNLSSIPYSCLSQSAWLGRCACAQMTKIAGRQCKDVVPTSLARVAGSQQQRPGFRDTFLILSPDLAFDTHICTAPEGAAKRRETAPAGKAGCVEPSTAGVLDGDLPRQGPLLPQKAPAGTHSASAHGPSPSLFHVRTIQLGTSERVS